MVKIRGFKFSKISFEYCINLLKLILIDWEIKFKLIVYISQNVAKYKQKQAKDPQYTIRFHDKEKIKA